MYEEAFVLSSARTRFGRYGGLHALQRPDDLLASLMSRMTSRDGISPSAIGDVIIGNANGAGEENRNVARMSALLAGFPVETPGVTVNRLCGSSLEAVIQASRAVRVGDNQAVLAGGVESMTRAPLVLPKPAKAFPATNMTAESTTLGWRLTNPNMPREWTVSLGGANEQLARKHAVTRSDQDQFAFDSHKRATAAWAAGHYSSLVVDEEGPDEGIRDQISLEALASLAPAFAEDGSITAGNASPLSDGASLTLIGSREFAAGAGLDARIRVASSAAVGNDPRDFGIAPVKAGVLATERAGISLSEVGAIELNEAFAAQALACMREWAVDPAVVNAWGGAIALGHPLGATGSRLIGTLAARMQHGGIRWGLAALCIGVGQGLAVVLENTDAENGAPADD